MVSESMKQELVADNERMRFWQRCMLLLTMMCYLFYYTGRQTFGFAMPGIEAELGIDKETLGWISAALLWSYAIGQAINGNLADKFGGRRMMSAGAILSTLLNWVTSFGTSFVSLIIPWGINGYAQSMGWAPGSRVISNWWAAESRGKAYGFYVFAAGLSSVLTFVSSMVILQMGFDWRWIFRLPVIALLLAGVLYYLLARDRPQELGLLPPEDEQRPDSDEITVETKLSSWQRYRNVLGNKRFLLAAIAIGFQNTARYGLLIWVPVHFLGEDWKNSDDKWISVALPVGMALGAIASGWISDNVFRSNRSKVIILFMTLAAACSVVMYFLPRGSWLGIVVLFFTGFFAYGPQASFWALCPDMLGVENVGTGTGVMNCFAYGFAGLGEPLIGRLMDTYDETSLVFVVVAISCMASAVMAVGIRR
jgi:OPA family glycerol-3-phosphate transporter-like MFS transporter|tara:strand:- start:1192 stop:2460 length:1269 start_codon:yes stop_codon:yes gene_type:complete